MHSKPSLVRAAAALALGACTSPPVAPPRSGLDFLTPVMLAGRWQQSYEVMLPLSDGRPDQSAGTSECQSVCGGRYSLDHTIVDPHGEALESYELLDWDAHAQSCTSLWFDTANTWWCESRGEKQADGSMLFEGQMHDQAGDRPFRMVLAPRRDGTLVREVYDTLEDGSLKLVMKVISTR